MAKVTVHPRADGIAAVSVTVAASEGGEGRPHRRVLGRSPRSAQMLAGAPGRLVRAKPAGVNSPVPVRLAVTL